MQLLQNKKAVIVLSGVIALVLFGALILTASRDKEQGVPMVEQQVQQPTSAESRLSMRPDMGLNMEYVDLQSLGVEFGNVDPDSIGERVIFERYRFYDAEDDKEAIDIRADGVRAFVTAPSGMEEEITSGDIYYLMRIYPFSDAGTYAFRVETKEDTVYESELVFPKPQQAGLIFAEGTFKNDEGVSMQALRMGDLDLSNAESLFHILADNTIKDLTPNVEGAMLIEADVLTSDNHIFLAKQDGAWYYATFFTPEEPE